MKFTLTTFLNIDQSLLDSDYPGKVMASTHDYMNTIVGVHVNGGTLAKGNIPTKDVSYVYTWDASMLMWIVKIPAEKGRTVAERYNNGSEIALFKEETDVRIFCGAHQRFARKFEPTFIPINW